jgi:RimJ/RimL family protein N-acetyltransferase
MIALPDPSLRIATDRLVLRPTRASDAECAFAIQSDWDVTRMLRMASYPPAREEIAGWFADHAREWEAAEAFRFAVEQHGRLVGVVDIDSIAQGKGDLGYWFERVSWGRGLACEACHAVVRFAFAEAGLAALRSAHALDNPASGRVLLKLGFRPLDTVERYSRPRAGPVMQRRYVLAGPVTSD